MRLIVLSALFLLTACGFRPLHSEAYQAELSANMASVDIQVDNTRLGQLLKAEIEDHVNPGAQAVPKLFRIDIGVQEVEIALFINPDGTSSRGDIEYHSQYVIRRIADDTIFDTGKLKRISSYNTSESADYSSYVSEEDARRRGILELAQDYKLRIANLLPVLNGQVPIREAAPANAPAEPPPLEPFRPGLYNRNAI